MSAVSQASSLHSCSRARWQVRRQARTHLLKGRSVSDSLTSAGAKDRPSLPWSSCPPPRPLRSLAPCGSAPRSRSFTPLPPRQKLHHTLTVALTSGPAAASPSRGACTPGSGGSLPPGGLACRSGCRGGSAVSQARASATCVSGRRTAPAAGSALPAAARAAGSTPPPGADPGGGALLLPLAACMQDRRSLLADRSQKGRAGAAQKTPTSGWSAAALKQPG